MADIILFAVMVLIWAIAAAVYGKSLKNPYSKRLKKHFTACFVVSLTIVPIYALITNPGALLHGSLCNALLNAIIYYMAIPTGWEFFHEIKG